MGNGHSSWIIEPTFDDHDLSDYFCGNSSATHVTCPPMRSCEWDLTFAQDPLYPQCAGHGCETCLHKTLWPLANGDYLTGAFLFVCGTLAGASGIGGGGLNVPLLMLSGSFLVSEAVPLSHVMVFGNAIAQNLINAPRTHPHSERRALIDLEMPLLMLPSMLGGNTIGVLISPVLPASGVEALAILLLGYAGLKTLYTARKTYKKENAETQAAQLVAGTTNATGFDGRSHLTAVKPLLPNDTLAGGSYASAIGAPYPVEAPPLGGSLDGRVEGVSRPAEESQSFGFDMRLGLLMLLWLAIVLDFLGAKKWGGHGSVCSTPKLAWLFAQLTLVTVAAVGGGLYLLRAQRARDASGEARLPGDIVWRANNVISLPLLGVLVGVVAGLLGLGGGELMAPLLLAVGMIPQVASATSACMVLFTSSADIAHYAFEGVLSPDPRYVATLACLGFLSAFIGRTGALRLVRQLSHPSIIAFVLGLVLLLALALLCVQVVRAKPDWSFANLCAK